MEADFGWDFLEGVDGDCVFSPDGDIAVVQGSALVAQDVRTAALLSVGSLFYAEDFGQGLTGMLHGLSRGNSAGSAIARKLRQAALGDERVDWDTVQAGQYSDGKYYLKFSVLGSLENSLLLFDMEDILNG